MEATSVQQHFFQHIKNGLPPHLSLAEDLAGVLDISNDSAYRRIRGEKPISFEELQKLCGHYKISLDQFLHLQSDAIVFSGKLNPFTGDSFAEWLENVRKEFSMFNSFEKKHLYYLMKDIPPFVHFQIPELAAFKCFFWMKSILHYDTLKGVKFEFNDPRYDQYLEASKKIIELYNKIPITEVWNIESINSTLRQIHFYHESGAFKNTADVHLLYEKVKELIDHIERQAELGLKFPIGTQPGPTAVEYRMFVNELVLGDNTIMAELDGNYYSFLNHSVLYFVGTRDDRFNKATLNNMNNLISKSTMISKSSEKERVRFFNRLRDKISHQQRHS